MVRRLLAARLRGARPLPLAQIHGPLVRVRVKVRVTCKLEVRVRGGSRDRGS